MNLHLVDLTQNVGKTMELELVTALKVMKAIRSISREDVVESVK